MGCCTSSPYTNRVYRDPGDYDEEIVPLRYFGTIRSGSNLAPDDIGGLPSTHLQQHLATHSDLILYEAEMDNGYGFRCYRFIYLCVFTPWGFLYIASKGLGKLCKVWSCDEACCWLRKEYSTRSFFRIYPNRLVVNHPAVRFPWGYLGCGSWNADSILSHPFDRGAFGFSEQYCLTKDYLCSVWPIYGGTVARHRCQCNGPLWNRMFTDCGGWWCDEWPCSLGFCTYQYTGLARPDEVTFACSIALQAYFEGRAITKEDMDKCIEFWRDNIAESTDPVRRKRRVCCEPLYVPCCTCDKCHDFTHPKREIPYGDSELTTELREAYEKYEVTRQRQIDRYTNYQGPVRTSTLCRAGGCRRCFGRRGCFFCTEGCNNWDRKVGDPAPPFDDDDVDDYFDASAILFKVVGPPPPNVVIRRWRWNPQQGKQVLETYAHESALPLLDFDTKAHDS